MLGVIEMAGSQGAGDRLMAAVARALRSEGVSLAGVVQENTEYDPSRPCHMDLLVLRCDDRVRISEDRGPGARGCRLYAAGLAAAAGLVEAVLATEGESAPRLLIVNKFGKEEAEGRGFRPAIGRALAMGLPVLTSVGPRNAQAFADFAEGMANVLQAEEAAVLAWCRKVVARG
ncbi:MAG TPA: DUF2478 domain-containing protein [Paracoccaceae bacterium]|nr:DUF2478 domain-containing protein [Paracoccaceae bacterium]HMO70395.1 DUF2478 domain-containing protein [Paracoccaceae bacterium]